MSYFFPHFILAPGGARYAVKYYNSSLIDEHVLGGITRVLSLLKKDDFNVPEPLDNLSGANITQVTNNQWSLKNVLLNSKICVRPS